MDRASCGSQGREIVHRLGGGKSLVAGRGYAQGSSSVRRPPRLPRSILAMLTAAMPEPETSYPLAALSRAESRDLIRAARLRWIVFLAAA